MLIHGLSGSSRWWMRNFDALAERHLVAAVDLVGFGRSHRAIIPEILPAFGEVSALLARWLETFGEPVHLVGHSMGGQLAIRLAAERPELVRSLMLVNSAGMPFKLDPLAHLRPLPRPPFGGPRIAQVLLPDFVRAGPTSVVVASARVLRGDMRTWMHGIRAPTLLVWGENDPLVPLRYGKAMQQEIAGSRLIVIPRAAHVSMWDAPEEFNRIATAWLEEMDARDLADSGAGVFAWGVTGYNDGVAHRQAGHDRNVVLVHGLGMSSAYFEPFARALFARGFHPVAPDLPGFGESANARAGGPDAHAAILAAWADKLGIRDAIWIGHSIGCNAVAAVARIRPELVRSGVFIGPLWTRSSIPNLRLVVDLALDALREPLALYRYVFPAYWRTGIARWWLTWRRFARDLACPPALPERSLLLAGDRDPIPDRRCLDLREVDGAHACQFSNPEAVADVVRELN